MESIQSAIEVLKNGGTILYPTDTIWGIGCDATNFKAVEKVIQIKQRPSEKSFIVLVDSIAMLERYVTEFPDVCYDLIDFTDKPLTVIYEDVVGVAQNTLAQDGSLGIRVTSDPICLKLIRGVRKPLLSTSANFSGEPSPSCYDEVSEKLKQQVDVIVKERLNVKCSKPSSIIKVGKDSSIKIIRK